MSRQFLLSMLIALSLGGGSLKAQSYQTSFSDVKFDRAKGPATIHAGLEVDAATGAASMNIPFGPGIGERGLKFTPTLSMRIGPQMGISSAEENIIVVPAAFSNAAIWGLTTIETLYQRSFGSASFSPGTLTLGTMVSTFDRKPTTYSLPNGGGGRVLGQVPAGIDSTNINTLLRKFGFSATDTVGFLPGRTDRPSKAAFIQMGSDSSLIVGLRVDGPSTALTDEVRDDIQQYPTSNLYQWDFPRRVAVIHGEVAYEFHYVRHTYMTRHIPYLTISEKTQLYSGHYVITKIRNKLGESIDFSYDSDGSGYTATWSVNPSVKIRVQAVGSVAVSSQPSLNNSNFPLASATRIRVSYQGISQPVSTFLLDFSDPTLGTAPTLFGPGGPDSAAANSPNGIIDWDWQGYGAALESMQPLRIYKEATLEEIRFTWGVGPTFSWDNWLSLTRGPTVLSSVAFPTRDVTLTWEPYRYRANYNPEGWGGVASSSLPGRPAVAYGVIQTLDSGGPLSRQTTHHRVVPMSNWNNLPVGQTIADQWTDTTFYDAVTQPDGSVSVHRFVSPPSINALTGADGMQNLAFIKTLEREVRYYQPGADWQSDLAVTTPASSSAYKWVVKDRFDVRTPGSTNGGLGNQSVPYPTRTRTWEKENQILTIQESSGWDEAAFGWKASHTTTSIVANPNLAMDYLSLAQAGQAYSPYPAPLGVYRKTEKTFEPNIADWIISREKSEQSTTVEDNTGFLASGGTLPDAQPLVTKTFNPNVNRVDSVAVSNSGAPTVTTDFTFIGTTGVAAIEIQSAFLNSTGLGLSGQFGVSSYSYDANGYLNAISQKPDASKTLTVSQESDELGRPKTQTDLNGTIKTYTWDQGGRLSGISSSDGDEPISIVYNDTDHLGITVTQGLRILEYRYNAFGQLILERRTAQDGTKSHRIHGYDCVGRPTGETVWLLGDGAAHEGEWLNAALTRSNTSTTVVPERTTCKKWGLDDAGNAVCLTWQTIPASTTTVTTAALYLGAATKYDGRGRAIWTQDANGIQTTTDYFGPGNLPPGVASYIGPITRVTVGTTQVKWFESDSVGRFVRMITPVTRYVDPMNSPSKSVVNLRTEYRYDTGGRVKDVRQYDEANRTQTRTWAYNRLGWLESLEQPESGITSYSGFTVAGKPTVTSYAGRVVRMSPDWMGRPLNVAADDGSVTQAFVYDTATGGKGRLASSTDGAVTTEYNYSGQGNRLSSLSTTTLVQGANQTFTQTYIHDTSGNRTGGNTSHGAWTQTYHSLTGLPNILTYGTGNVASTPWVYYDSVSWALKSIAYGNGAASNFDYDPDQARLKEMKHLDGQAVLQAHWGFKYDDVGNMVTEFDKTRPDGAGSYAFDQFGYDELNRLISAVVQSSSYGEQLQEFDYDAFGNRISSNIRRVTSWQGVKGASTAYVTSSGLLSAQGTQVVNATFSQGSTALMQNRLPNVTSTGVPTGATYDLQGNLLTLYEKPTSVNPVLLTMTYDALGRVLTVSSSKTGLTEKYKYTAEGLRTVVEEYNASTLQKTRVNIYNDSRQLVAQYEKAPAGVLTWKRDILYLGTREAAEIDAAGMHVTQVDHLGSPRVITGPTGAVETKQKYLPFGELLEQSGAFRTAKGYTNHEQTDTSGLVYMQARFYVPWFGRFASPDPARDQHFDNGQSWNIYSYVRNNPVMSTDPTGMEEEKKEKNVNSGAVGPNDRPYIAAGEPPPATPAQTKLISDKLTEYTKKSSTLSNARNYLGTKPDGDLNLIVINDPKSNVIANYDNNAWTMTVNIANVMTDGLVNDAVLSNALGHEYRHAEADALAVSSESRTVDLRDSGGGLRNSTMTSSSDYSRFRNEAARDGAAASNTNLSPRSRNQALKRYWDNPIEIDARCAGAKVASEVGNAK